MPNDLIDAAIQQLRATPACVSAFGDTWIPNPTPTATNLGTGVIKFWSDFAGNYTPPYLVLTETGERYEYMTEQATSPPTYSFTSPGQFMCSIFGGPSRYAVRQLGNQVALALNDAPLDWTGQTLMSLRMGAASFVPIKDVGPGVATMFNRVLIFDYTYSGEIA